MITPILFITRPLSAFSNNAEYFADPEIGINILIDSTEIDMPAIINLTRQKSLNYILSISQEILDSDNIQACLPQLYSLFVLSGFFRKKIRCIPVFSNTADFNPQLTGSVRDYFELQGEKNLVFDLFTESFTEEQIGNEVLVLKHAQLEKLNEELFEKYTNLKASLIILPPWPDGDFNEEIKCIKSILKENKYIRELVRFNRARIETSWLKHELSLWKQRSDLYYSFIDLGKKVGENQYYDILNWYAKEYEVLPLWYKRFGHIIKYLTGKRKLITLRK